VDTIEWLTAALVAITAYYAWRTQQMVREMRHARELSVRPILAIELRFIAPNFADLAITNAGAGPAVDVDVELVAEPTATSEHERDARRWRTSVLAPGGSHEFAPPAGLNMEDFAREFACVRVQGTLRDALGEQREVEAEIADLADTWKRMGAANQLWKDDPTDKATRALVKPLGELQRELRAIRRVATGEHSRAMQESRRRRRRRLRAARLLELKRRLHLRS
jgi:hypothetical protein